MGGADDLRPPTRVTLTRGSPRVTASPIRVTLTGLPPPFFFHLLMLFGFAAFYLAFILVMPTFAAISACNRVAEMVLVFHLLTIFCYLLALQLEHASASPIIVRGVARSTFVACRTTVENIRDPFAIGGGVCCMCFN